MYLYTVASSGEKISIKAFLGILSFVCVILFLQGQVAAQAAQFKTAFIRASDNKVYQIHYEKPVSIENFLITNVNGDSVPRDIAAELYLAARFLNEPPFAFEDGELREWVEEEYRHTAKWKKYHSVATYVGSISAGFLTGQLTSGIGITASIVQSEAGKHAIQGLTTITSFVGEQAVLVQAYAITDVFVERTVSKRRIVDNLLSSANAGTEINIEDLKFAYNAHFQSVKYLQWVGWMVEEYLTLPSRWERLWTFAKTIFPLSSLGQFFASAGENIEDLRTLQRIFDESDRRIATEASATVNSIFDEDTIASHVAELENGGFFENKGPRLIASIRTQWLTVGDPPTILDLSNYFRDPNGDPLTYEVWADDYDEIEGERNGSVIEITPIAAGSTTVRIIATDPSSGLETSEIFFVFVNDPPRRVQNQKPKPVGSVPDQTVEIGESLSPLDISGYFHDPDGDTLTYTAWSIPTSIVSVEREGSKITITPVSEGSTTVTVRATDPDGLRTFQRISVTVTAPQTPQDQRPMIVTPTPSSQEFEIGDAVIVQNTAPSYLNIRGGAGLAWGKKGQVSDGATGTITDGPVSKNNFVWWKIRWDDSNKVVWTNRPVSNEAWSVEAIDGTEYLAPRPSDPVVQSFDLAIQSFTANKTNLAPDEYFTLNITIHNNGPGRSAASDLSYYHSSVQGRAPTDPPRIQGTVSLDPIAPSRSITKSIRLRAPSTHSTYYYGAWVTPNTDDTNAYNNAATEVGVIVSDSPNQISSNSPDLVIESISANKVVLAPGEAFRLDTIVQNQGKVDASSTYLRYYRSSDATISPNDTEVGDDRMTTPDAGETYDKWERLTAPDTPGIYYYGACVDSVTGEINTLNNCSEAIEITVQTASPPDLVIDSISADKVSLDPNGRFKLTAIVRNQGEVDASSTKLRYFLSSDATISPDDDTEVDTRNVRALEENEISEGLKTLRVPDTPGVYYYGACVDSVTGESDVNNNCSEIIAITVQPPALPDLIVESIRASKVSLEPGETFTLYAKVKNQGRIKSPATRLYYYGPGGNEIGSILAPRLFPDGVSEKSLSITASNSPGAYTYKVCVSKIVNESNQDNNCSATVSVAVGLDSSNTPPSAVNSVPAQTLTADGTARRVNVSIYFRDADGDRLTYTARSDDTSVVTVSASGDEVTIIPRVAGRATVTVTASDGIFAATQRFSVTVTATRTPNRAPVSAGTISSRTLAEGDPSERVDISGNFRDPDGDRLSYIVRSDNTSVARVSVSGTQVTIAPKSAGSATVTVTASDGELTATQRFSVTVTATPVANRAPVTVGTISSRTFTVGDPTERVFVSGYFQDPDNDSLIYTASSNNTGVATVNYSGSLITVTARGVGSAMVTVTASDGELTATQRFSVTVTATPVANRAPVTVGTISPRTLTVDGSSERVNVSSYFRDPDNNSLVYTVNSDNTTVATVDVSGTQITITPQGVGSATITVTASDGNLTVLQAFTVTVTGVQTRQVGTQSDICDRTQQVLDEILAEMDVEDCADLGSDDLSSITSLGLHDAGITTLKDYDFQGLTGLDDLDLSDNSLRSLPAGVFNGLTALFSLELYNNSLSSLPVSVFNELGALDFLDLEGNSLSSLSVGVFDGLSALRSLDLKENSLGSLPVDIFDELSTLRKLDLDDNSLRSLPVGAFNGLSALDTLELRGNSLSSLPVGVFGGLSALESLDLRENSLSSLPIGIFDGLDALEVLDLEDNQFTTLPKGIFDDVLDTLGSSSWKLGVDDSLKTTFGFSTTSQDAAEGDTVRVTVNLGRALPVAVRVPYTVGGTATAADYSNLQTPTELLFLAGETSKEIVFTLLEDADTTAETISLTLAELGDVKFRKSDGSGSDAALSAYTLLNEPQQTIHTVTVTTGGESVSRPMYWTAGDNKIRRSKLDGTLVQVLFEGGNLRGIALDVSGGKMYWVDTRIDAIRRANLDGSGVVNLVTDLGSPTGLALDISGGKMYWLDSSTDKIQRANLNGSGIEDLVTGLDKPKEIALDVSGGKMYWTDSGIDKIQRANLNGTNVEDLVTGLSSPRGIALDVSGGKMYWVDSSTNKIQRANLDGTNIEDLVTGIDIGADGLALDVSGGKMYWADNQEDKVQRANLDGSQIQQLYSGGYPIGIALAIGSGAVNAAPSAVSANLALMLPSETGLMPNYPNPFNPETWIPYRLSKPADVTLTIYNVRGVVVRQLALGYQSAGIYHSRSRAAYWDGRNTLGEPVASGVYFYTLEAGEFTATRKMLIRK